MPARFDRRLISQALTNIVKNATEAIAAVPAAERGPRPHPRDRGARRRATSSSTWSTTASACRRRTATGCSSPTSRRARRAPASASRSSGGSWRSTAAGSSCSMHRRNSRRARRLAAAAASPNEPTRPNRPAEVNQLSSEQVAHGVRHSDRRRRGRHPRARRRHPAGRGPRHAHRRATATPRLAEIAARRPNLVFLDIWLQGSRLDGLQLLDAVKEQHPDLPVVMISGHGNIETAVSAIKRGAYDFIEKPFKADRLVLVAERALEASRLKREVKELKALTAAADQHGRPLAGDEPAPPDHREGRADQQPHHDRRPRPAPARSWPRAPSHDPVRPRERAVRRHQRRRDHARAHGGRAVRHRAVERRAAAQGRRAGGGPRRHALSSTRSPTCRARRRTRSCACWSSRPSSASAARPRSPSMCASSPRPAATSRPRSRRAASARTSSIGLSVVPIRVPALAERREDIPDLVDYFMEQISQSTGLPQRKIGDDAMAVLQAHDWPGNVRQLRNNVERLMILAARRCRRDDHRRHAAAGDRRDGAVDAATARRRAAHVAAAARGARDCSSANICWRRSTASAATSRAPPSSSAWSARRCTAS